MPNYFAITQYTVTDLGFFICNMEAEDYAMREFNLNLNLDSDAWLVLTSEELKQLTEKASKLPEETNT